MSFCRITGRARNLPKPNFFPIIPPISPADAQKLCRITGKRADDHRYVPLLEAGRRPESSSRCQVTGKNLGGKNTSYSIPVDRDKLAAAESGLHVPQNDYKYVAPVLERSSMDKGDLRAFDDLMNVLRRLRKEMLADGRLDEDKDKEFVYLLPSVLCGLVVSPEIEEAIRQGELESVSLSRNCDRAIFKAKGKRTLFVPLKEVDPNAPAKSKDGESADKKRELFNGKGQSKETLNRQRQALASKKKKGLPVNKKVFENLERRAEEEMQREIDQSSKQGNKVSGGSKRSKEAQQYRQKVDKFRQKYLSENNMSAYGDCGKALKTNLHMIDWERVARLKSSDLKKLPTPGKRKKLERKITWELRKQLAAKKRIKNVYIPDHCGLELVPVVEDFAIQGCQIPEELLLFIKQSKEEGCPLGMSSSLKSMFACEEALKILPTLKEFEGICTGMKEGKVKLRMGCMYDRGDGAKYAEDPSMVPPGANIILGAVVTGDDNLPKFIPGEKVEKKGGAEVFVPGQRMASSMGEFIPGASIRGEDGAFQFIPGVLSSISESREDQQDGSCPFIAGQFVTPQDVKEDGGRDLLPKFIRGQVVHTAAGAKFVEGETVLTADGLKFVAGYSYSNSNLYLIQ